jgi:hypothetical protein
MKRSLFALALVFALPVVAAPLDVAHARLAKPEDFTRLAAPDISSDIRALHVLPKKPAAIGFVVGGDGKPQNVTLVQSSGVPQIDSAGRDWIAQCRLKPELAGKVLVATFGFTHTAP